MAEERVLVVEDEDIVRESLTRLLCEAGYAPDAVGSAEEGLACLRNGSFDLLLVDRKLPGMSGLQFLTEVRSYDAQVAVLVITGYATVENAIGVMELGVQGFIRKPVTPERLLRSVSEALGRQRALPDTTRLRALAPLWELSQALMEARGVEQLASALVRIVAVETQNDGVALLVTDEATGKLRVAGAQGFSLASLRDGEGELERLGNIACPSGKLLELERRQGESGTLPGVLLTWGEGSVLCLPMVVSGRTVGVLLLGKGDGAAVCGPGEVEFLSVVCNLVSLALPGHVLDPHFPSVSSG